ncbi:MAG: ketopantoate reductase family protein [Kurthia sp.]|nr:ketopantoate reductase family protein [Candidatus Kurthia equi]
MTIQSISIIGLGALGILYAEHFTKHLHNENLQIIADESRIQRYESQGIYCNGELCHFNYATPGSIHTPSDLIIVATKFEGLEEAIQTIKPLVGEQTIILSVINGIISEEMLAEAFGYQHVLYCVAQGMDAVKQKNQMTYVNKGLLCIGNDHPEMSSQALSSVATFFEKSQLPFEIDANMRHRLWGKFMLNVGVNQTLASIEGKYGDIFLDGPPRQTMVGAMREVIQIANLEGVALTESDLDYWLQVLSKLSPDGKPSMAQDVGAKRKSELPLFAGTVLKLARKHQLAVPYNESLYDIITQKEMLY